MKWHENSHVARNQWSKNKQTDTFEVGPNQLTDKDAANEAAICGNRSCSSTAIIEAELETVWILKLKSINERQSIDQSI